jgi:hypothetical protein
MSESDRLSDKLLCGLVTLAGDIWQEPDGEQLVLELIQVADELWRLHVDNHIRKTLEPAIKDELLKTMEPRQRALYQEHLWKALDRQWEVRKAGFYQERGITTIPPYGTIEEERLHQAELVDRHKLFAVLKGDNEAEFRTNVWPQMEREELTKATAPDRARYNAECCEGFGRRFIALLVATGCPINSDGALVDSAGSPEVDGSCLEVAHCASQERALRADVLRS